MQDSMLPLQGIRILDFSRYAPGRYCSMLLADFGADVITIEPTRTPEIRAPPIRDSDPRYYCFARNKRSIALNLRIPQAREVIYRLVERSDVVIEGFRPGVAQRLGIDYPKLSQINPKLIYCSLSGFGQDGPYAGFPGHDINYLGIAGILSLTRCIHGHPAMIGTQISDLAVSWNAVVAILLALIQRNITGKGKYIDLSYLDCAFCLNWILGPELLNTGKMSQTLLGNYPCYNIYPTKDGKYLSLGIVMPLEPWFWERLCNLISRPDLIPRFNDPGVIQILEQIFKERTRDEWMKLLREADIPCGPVNTLEEALRDPQIIHREMIQETQHPKLGKIKLIRNPIRISGMEFRIRIPPHGYGEHTIQILEELGYTRSQIQELKKMGAIE